MSNKKPKRKPGRKSAEFIRRSASAKRAAATRASNRAAKAAAAARRRQSALKGAETRRKNRERERRSRAGKKGAEKRKKKVEFREELEGGDPKPTDFGNFEYVGEEHYIRTDFTHRVYELHKPGVGTIREVVRLEQSENTGGEMLVFGTIGWYDDKNVLQHRSTQFYLAEDGIWESISDAISDLEDEYGIAVISSITLNFTTGS